MGKIEKLKKKIKIVTHTPSRGKLDQGADTGVEGVLRTKEVRTSHGGAAS
jgi:hypothetical protein